MTLKHEAQALIEAGRKALRPSAADRERIFLSLEKRLGDGAGPEPDGGTPAAASGLGGPAIGAIVVGVSLVGALVFSAFRSEAPVPRKSPPVPAEVVVPAPVVPPEPANPANPAEPVEPAPAPVAPSPPSDGAASSRKKSDRLAEEVAILSRAETDLHAGRFAAALRALDEHQRSFPSGALTQERVAARARALCALGRTAEAEADLARLARLAPNSPLESRARKACATSSKKN